MLSITVHVTGLDNVKERLNKLGKSLYDFTDTFEALKEQLLLFYGETVFVSHGQALGHPWVGLKATTVKEKVKKWPGRGILQRSGELQHSFTGEVTPVSLFITNNSDHFLPHQLGTGGKGEATAGRMMIARHLVGIGGGGRIGRGNNLPARPMLGVNGAVEKIIKEEVELGVRKKIDLAMGLK